MRIVIVVAFLAVMYVILFRDTGIVGRKKLLNKEKAQPDAVIEKIEPVVFGSPSTKHYEIVVTFSDGTSYRDKCSITDPGYLKYTISVDQEKVKPIVDAALEAHRQAVQEAGRA